MHILQTVNAAKPLADTVSSSSGEEESSEEEEEEEQVRYSAGSIQVLPCFAAALVT